MKPAPTSSDFPPLLYSVIDVAANDHEEWTREEDGQEKGDRSGEPRDTGHRIRRQTGVKIAPMWFKIEALG